MSFCRKHIPLDAAPDEQLCTRCGQVRNYHPIGKWTRWRGASSPKPRFCDVCGVTDEEFAVRTFGAALSDAGHPGKMAHVACVRRVRMLSDRT